MEKQAYEGSESKVEIYKTCIRPILTYTAETSADTAVTQNDMATVESETLRAIAGYTMYDQKTNEEIGKIGNRAEIEVRHGEVTSEEYRMDACRS